MELKTLRNKQYLKFDIESAAALIAEEQYENGEIPWCRGDKTDPWDHVEAAMGLTIGGYHREAKKAYEWLAKNQLADGSWYTNYIKGVPKDLTRDSNMSSYIAVMYALLAIIQLSPIIISCAEPMRTPGQIRQ